MKLLIFGDIHGRDCWEEVIIKETPDKVIFLGDYVSTHDKNMTSEQQCSNLEDILNYKEKNSDKVILLRGNHDIQHLGYYWARCSGFDNKVYNWMSNVKERFLKLTQWIHIENNIIFSHAGISQVWLDNNKLSLRGINNEPPSEKFAFTPDNPNDYSGHSITQPPTWIRPYSLIDCNIKGYSQVVGHTPVSDICNLKNFKDCNIEEDIWLCDALPDQYLIIEDNNFTVKNI